jgi:hypothetical protein
MNNIIILLYRILEKLDGEKGFKVLDYQIAESLKLLILGFPLSFIIKSWSRAKKNQKGGF